MTRGMNGCIGKGRTNGGSMEGERWTDVDGWESQPLTISFACLTTELRSWRKKHNSLQYIINSNGNTEVSITVPHL